VGEEFKAGKINESNINCYAELVFIPDVKEKKTNSLRHILQSRNDNF
jgi:hypothetical protein